MDYRASVSDPAGTTFAVLGRLEVRDDGGLVPVGRRRERALLGLLLLEAGKAVSVQRLADLLWDGTPPLSAAAALHIHMSRLRASLDTDRTARHGLRLHTDRGGYRAEVDPGQVDVHRFTAMVADARRTADAGPRAELLRAAGALWRGRLLEDCGSDLLRHRIGVALDELRLIALEGALDAELDLGRHEETVAELASLTSRYPRRERLWSLFALALYRCNRRVEALEALASARGYLVEEAGVDLGDALRELQRRILHDDPALLTVATRTATAGQPPPGPVVPRQLPPAPPAFVGRRSQLAELDRATGAGGTGDPTGTAAGDAAGSGAAVLISTVAGAGGIGKTSLALHWAHTHLDRFPDGQLFVDLRGFSPMEEPLTPAAAIRGFLDALGIAAGRIPNDLAGQAALYRSVMAGKRMLVVLDNAADDEQIEHLLPGAASCTVLVTSRRTLRALIALHGARHLPLTVLSDSEAHALLAGRLGQRVAAEPEATAELIRLCGRYPLALTVMAAQAEIRRTIPLAEFAAELRDIGLEALRGATPTSSVPAVLSWSLRGLTARQRRVFGLLGVAPGPDIGLPAAASLTGLPERDTGRLLSELEEASLLERQPGGRYSMHDLIRAYAATVDDLTEDVLEDALRRVVDFYTHTAHAANRLLSPHRTDIRLDPPAPGTRTHHIADPHAAMAWFDVEHANLMAAQRTAAGHGWHHPVWQLAWSLTTYHVRRVHRHDELAAWQAAHDAATRLPDPAVVARTSSHVGVAYAELGRGDEATRYLDEALVLTERHGDTGEQAQTHRMLAWAWELRGDDERALEHAVRALTLFRTAGSPIWVARALNLAGWFCARLGRFDTARARCQEALALFREHNDAIGEAATVDSLGYIAHHVGRHDEAVGHYRDALARFRDLGDVRLVADTLDRLGHPHAALGHREQASAVWQEALTLYRQQGLDDQAERIRRQLDALGH